MRTFYWLSLILLFPLFSSAQYTSKLPIIAYDNCEVDPVWQWDGDRTKKWSYWSGANHILPGSSTTASMTRSTTYVRKGNYSYKARITKDPTYTMTNGTVRSEMTFSTPSQPPIGWRWAAVSVYLPDDFCIDQSPMTIAFDTKASPDNYSTPFRLDIRGGRLIAIRANVQTNGTVPNEIEKDLGPVVRGVWTDWVYHRNFEMNSSGFIELYRNGVLVFSYNGPNWVNGAGRTTEAYLPMGIYKWPWLDPNGAGWGPPACQDPVEVYYDEFRFGTDQATLQDFLIDQAPPPPPPPAIAPTIANTISDQTLAYNTTSQTISLAGVFADDEGAANLQYSVSGNSNTTLIKSATISGTTVSLSVAADKSGVSAIKIKATDSDGLSVEDEFNVNVAAYVPVAPVVSNAIADIDLAYNTTSKSVSLTGVFSDEKPAGELTYTITGNSNTALVTGVSITGTTLLTSLAPGLSGSSTVIVKATDSDGLSITDQFIVSVAPETVTPAFSLLLNSGGPAVNFSGDTWSADKNFSGGSTYVSSAAIAGTTNDAIYQSERYGNMNYAVPVSSGKYTVRLHFAEIFFTTANSRKFNISIENGQAVLTGYDIVSKAGAAFTARVEEFKDITVTDGTLNINFTSIVDNAKISAIEIIGAAANKAPTIATAIADQTFGVETASKSISLAAAFADDKGLANLTYTVSSNSNKAVVATTAISGSTLTMNFTGTAAGKSVITIRATDTEGLYVDEIFNVTITNKAPLANAGVDQTITLPVSQTILNGSGSDSDGTIKAYTWSQVSGPTATFSSKTIAKPTITGLTTAGTYVFQLKVTDNINAASTNDQVNVVVKPVPGLNVSTLTLVNATSDNDIQPITNGMQINLATTGTALNIRANTLPTTAGRVVFALSGTSTYNASESAAPFALYGDASGNYNVWTPVPGTYTLKATPYTTASGGVAGEPMTVTFTVVNQASAGARSVTIADATTPLSTADQNLKQMNDAPVITTLNAYPNPVTSQVTISYKTSKSAKLLVDMIDGSGKTVQRWPEESVYPGMIYRKTMNASKLPNGIYIYRITSSTGEIKTGRIVVAR